MHDHSETEHQNDRIHVKSDGICSVQNVKNTVIAEIYNQRIDGIAICFARADEDIVNDGTPRIRDIEGYKFDDNGENFIRISEILRITEKRSPCRNCNRPKYNACGGYEE